MSLTKIVTKAALLMLLSYGGVASAQYAANNPLRWVDPTGLDIRLENTTSVYGLHQRVSVDIPRGAQVIIGNHAIRDKFGISFGLRDENALQQGFFEARGDVPGFGKAGSGLVYPDVRDPMTKIQETFATTPEEDILAIQYFIQQLNKTAKYNAASNSCRDYSKDQLEAVKNFIEQYRIRERIKPVGQINIE